MLLTTVVPDVTIVVLCQGLCSIMKGDQRGITVKSHPWQVALYTHIRLWTVSYHLLMTLFFGAKWPEFICWRTINWATGYLPPFPLTQVDNIHARNRLWGNWTPDFSIINILWPWQLNLYYYLIYISCGLCVDYFTWMFLISYEKLKNFLKNFLWHSLQTSICLSSGVGQDQVKCTRILQLIK